VEDRLEVVVEAALETLDGLADDLGEREDVGDLRDSSS